MTARIVLVVLITLASSGVFAHAAPAIQAEHKILQRVSSIVATKSDEVRVEQFNELAQVVRSQPPTTIGRPAVVAAISRLLDDRTAAVAYGAVELLGHIGPAAKSSLPALKSKLRKFEAARELSEASMLGFKFNDRGDIFRYAIARIEGQSLAAFDPCYRGCRRSDLPDRVYVVTLRLSAP